MGRRRLRRKRGRSEGHPKATSAVSEVVAPASSQEQLQEELRDCGRKGRNAVIALLVLLGCAALVPTLPSDSSRWMSAIYIAGVALGLWLFCWLLASAHSALLCARWIERRLENARTRTDDGDLLERLISSDAPYAVFLRSFSFEARHVLAYEVGFSPTESGAVIDDYGVAEKLTAKVIAPVTTHLPVFALFNDRDFTRGEGLHMLRVDDGSWPRVFERCTSHASLIVVLVVESLSGGVEHELSRVFSSKRLRDRTMLLATEGAAELIEDRFYGSSPWILPEIPTSVPSFWSFLRDPLRAIEAPHPAEIPELPKGFSQALAHRVAQCSKPDCQGSIHQ
jgi:hypothetical protein